MADRVAALKRLRDDLRAKQAGWDKKLIEVGDFTYGTPLVLSWGEGSKLHIGKFCSIAEKVTVMLGGDHRNDWVSTYPFNALLPYSFGEIKGHPFTKGDVWIGNDVWLARDCKIMSGVRIEDGATVGANAVVTHDVPAYSVVVGVPAKVVKFKFPVPIIESLLKIRWWDWDIEKIAEAVPLLQSGDYQTLLNRYSVEWNDWSDII